MYRPDIQDELVADALAFGGQALVDDIQGGRPVGGGDVSVGGRSDEPAERIMAYCAVW